MLLHDRALLFREVMAPTVQIPRQSDITDVVQQRAGAERFHLSLRNPIGIPHNEREGTDIECV